jgi:hypothetical protein
LVAFALVVVLGILQGNRVITKGGFWASIFLRTNNETFSVVFPDTDSTDSFNVLVGINFHIDFSLCCFSDTDSTDSFNVLVGINFHIDFSLWCFPTQIAQIKVSLLARKKIDAQNSPLVITPTSLTPL